MYRVRECFTELSRKYLCGEMTEVNISIYRGEEGNVQREGRNRKWREAERRNAEGERVLRIR